VWAWCQKAKAFGRTVTVKVKYADFQIATRARSACGPVDSQETLHAMAVELIRSVFPLRKGVRLVGVSVSNFDRQVSASPAQMGLELVVPSADPLSIPA
jgi:DNA polymerase IV